MRQITYRSAIQEALREEMARDPNVILLGEDIGPGGVYGVTEGLQEKFGEERVIDMPIAETAIVGGAIGAALNGLRPVAEIMHSDFILVAMDGICNVAAKLRFASGGKASAPITIRAPSGASGAGLHHGQSLEACFLNVPGLKLVIPSTPYDAKGLLKASIRDNDPVIFFEHKYSYDVQGEVPEGEFTIPLGRADVKRPGKDVTLIALGGMVRQALEAAADLAAEGIDCEVVDPRTILPLDQKTILDSAAKTRRVVIVHEAPKTGGIGGEIAAVIAEKAFGDLKAPVMRVGAPFTPVPRRPYEEIYLPDKIKIAHAVRRVMA
ncbi:MAG: alpha-ketoacid dehydrogenase subunit beta [Deltaproteobacteria bacterium]|nr:alpha-ketoacid dehydrogenase subunit beta [Deltaproteobacteria bacterium]